MQNNYSNIIALINFLTELLHQRLDIFFKKTEVTSIHYPQLNLQNDESSLYKLLNRQDLSIEEKSVFMIAFIPHVQPNFFENIIQQYLPQGGDFLEIGGIKGSNQRSMLPTGETAQFILAGSDIELRLKIQQYLLNESNLIKEDIIQLEKVKDGEPFMSGKIILNEELLMLFLTNKEAEIKFGSDFPAKKITTQMDWDDAVLNESTLTNIKDIGIWLQYNKNLLEDKVLKRKIKPGYKALFYGASGTGKTLTAALLGKQFNKDVYRIDLSQVVSKYIGETEKNLEKIFSKAENKSWILFFDEADALFGKRTSVQNAHDRYANQEVSYLLQRIEDYNGLLILASNFKNNIDSAFTRRFNTMVYFPVPNAAERLCLWKKSLPETLQTEPVIELTQLANTYELTGAAILNVTHYAMLKTLSVNDNLMRMKDIMEGIRREMRKEDRTMN